MCTSFLTLKRARDEIEKEWLSGLIYDNNWFAGNLFIHNCLARLSAVLRWSRPKLPLRIGFEMEFIVPVHLHDLELPKSDRFCVSEPEASSNVEDEELMLANLQGMSRLKNCPTDASQAMEFAETRVELTSDPCSISNNIVFDKLYSVIRWVDVNDRPCLNQRFMIGSRRHWQAAAASVRAETVRQLVDALNQITSSVNDGIQEMPAEDMRTCFKCCTYLAIEASLAAQSAHVAELVQATGKAASKGVSEAHHFT